MVINPRIEIRDVCHCHMGESLVPSQQAVCTSTEVVITNAGIEELAIACYLDAIRENCPTGDRNSPALYVLGNLVNKCRKDKHVERVELCDRAESVSSLGSQEGAMRSDCPFENILARAKLANCFPVVLNRIKF